MERIQNLEQSISQNQLPKLDEDNLPDQNGYFGEYGGAFVDTQVEKDLQRVLETYVVAREDPNYTETLKKLYCDYVGRPSALFKCENLTKKVGGAQIYLKREDLNHTGAHKINHSLGQALLAKRMGKTRILGGTGAGQHGVAMSAAAALCGLKCEVYMGAVDVAKEHPNLLRMQCMGAKVVVVHDGQASLKAASDAAFKAYKLDIDNTFYCVGSVIGPHPFPMMVRDFQSIIGKEAIVQFKQKVGQNPDHLIACVGGGCNAIGLFSAFLKEPKIKFYGVEPAGKGLDTLKHAATLNGGKPGIISGYKCYFLQDQEGKVRETHTVASGLGNPAVGPQHCHYKDTGKVEYVGINDDEAISAFFELSREEGIIPAIESSHAVAYGLKLAKELPQNQHILINLSGRGDKDIDYVVDTFGAKFGITEKF